MKYVFIVFFWAAILYTNPLFFGWIFHNYPKLHIGKTTYDYCTPYYLVARVEDYTEDDKCSYCPYNGRIVCDSGYDSNNTN